MFGTFNNQNTAASFPQTQIPNGAGFPAASGINTGFVVSGVSQVGASFPISMGYPVFGVATGVFGGMMTRIVYL